VTTSTAGTDVSALELSTLQATVEAGIPAFLADLERMCNIDCGSYTPAGVNQIGDLVAAELASMGATVERRPDPKGKYGDTVIGTFEGAAGAGPRVLLIGHMDTVFSEGTVAKRSFRIDGSIAHGAGVSDMKAGLLAGLRAVAAVRALGVGSGPGGLPFERLTFVANPDEEIGSPSSTPHIKEIAATADATFVLECARANGDFVSARKGMADIRLTINGRAAHAGVEPEKGRSAILAGAEIVRGIHELNGRWPAVTTNVGVFKAGTRPNIVCDQAELQIDVRAMAAGPLASAIGAIRDLAAAPLVPDVSIDVEMPHALASRRRTCPPAERPTRTRHPAWVCRPSTAWGLSAAWITRLKSSSRSTPSCPGRHSSRRCCSRCRATPRSRAGGRLRPRREQFVVSGSS